MSNQHKSCSKFELPSNARHLSVAKIVLRKIQRMIEVPILINEEFWSQLAIDETDKELQRLQQLLRSQKRAVNDDAMTETDPDTDL